MGAKRRSPNVRALSARAPQTAEHDPPGGAPARQGGTMLEGIERPAPRPGGLPVADLGVYERHGGHTLRRHVDTKPGDELRRILREGVAAAGRFLNRATAQRCVDEAITAHSPDVRTWLAGPDSGVPCVCRQDWHEDYATTRDAASAFVRDAPRDGVRAAVRELDQLLDMRLDEATLSRLLREGFDCNYVPQVDELTNHDWLMQLRQLLMPGART